MADFVSVSTCKRICNINDRELLYLLAEGLVPFSADNDGKLLIDCEEIDVGTLNSIPAASVPEPIDDTIMQDMIASEVLLQLKSLVPEAVVLAEKLAAQRDS